MLTFIVMLVPGMQRGSVLQELDLTGNQVLLVVSCFQCFQSCTTLRFQGIMQSIVHWD